LQVADLPRSLDYYTGTLGLAVLHAASSLAAVGVEGAAPLVHLHERPGIARAPRGGRFGLFHFAVLLPDRAALGRFVERLFRTGGRAGMADHAVSEAIYLTDPDGLGIEVYADRPRATWSTRGRELVMTTEPLDIADLVAAAEGGAWAGAPPGTTIGHVHLHVGDLDAADAFYRAAIGFDKTVWTYPGALFFSAGGYHHHLGTNTWSPGPAATDDEARLLEWELLVPAAGDVEAFAASVAAGGYEADGGDGACAAADPWGTRVVVRSR
jgi:catechol 2,3-dioxygenase